MTDESSIKRAEDLNKRGLAFVQSEKVEEAIKYFDRAIEESPDYLEAFYNKATVYMACNEFNKALDIYDKIISKAPMEGEAYYQKANIILFIQNNINSAVELYNRALFLGEKDENIYFNLGICMEALNNNEDSLKWIERAIKINNSRIDFLLKKAQILTNMFKFEEAINCYDQVLMSEADNEEAYHFKALLLGELGRGTEALNTLMLAENIVGSNALIEYDKALLAEKSDDLEKALSYLDKGLAVEPDNIVLLSKKAALATFTNRENEAKAIFNKISEIAPENMENHFNKASLCMALGEYEEAVDICTKIIEESEEENPYKIASFYYKALTLNFAGRAEEAEAAYKEAIKNYTALCLYHPYDAQIHLLKANSLRDIKKCNEAEELYEYILDLEPDKTEVYLMRAKNRIYLGKQEEAKADIKYALSVNKTYKNLVDIDEELKDCLNR